ncbi:hypothetical protein SESBI_41101 [Sesbania bispinosa]|nr:hypothetical protein SESBI_41101 [Sesbania bispinosa]
MHRPVNNGAGGGDPRLRRHHYILHRDKAPDITNFLVDASPSSPDQPASASSLRRQVAASLMQHRRAIERNNHALQPLSPASYGSSMEYVPFWHLILSNMNLREQDRLHAAVQSVRDELEDERKLRKRSESIHRKLARELSEVKSSLTSVLKDLEQERTRRKLLEDLCDEFARGINEYEQEVHALKQKPDKDWVQRADQDRLILHISESWLDERMQMQLEAAQNGFMDKKSIVDKLSLEIETFLKAKQNSMNTENQVVRDGRNSLESVPLNEVVSAPQDVGDDDSAGSDSNCFELNKPSNRGSKAHQEEPMDKIFDETFKSNNKKKKAIPREGLKNCGPSNLQVRFEEHMAWAMSSNSNKKSQSIDAEQGKTTDTRPVEGTISEKPEHFEGSENGSFERKNNSNELHSSNKITLLIISSEVNFWHQRVAK